MPETEDNALLSYGRQTAFAWRAALRKTLLLPLAATLALAPLVFHGWYQHPVREVHKHLACLRNAVVVSTWQTDHGGERRPFVASVSLHVQGRPDARIELGPVDPDAFVDAKHLYLWGLGRYGFRVENRHLGTTDRGIDVGAEGDFAHLFPFRVRNVQDVVDRYDELVAVISKWPRHPARARLEQGPRKGATYAVQE